MRSAIVLSVLAACCLAGPQRPASAQEGQQAPAPRPSGPVQQKLVPGMAAYTDDVLFGDVWIRPELSPRDRSLVTISALIAMGRTAQLEGHLGRALANGVKPGEATGVLTHLAIYCGWPSAVSALEVYDRVFTARGVDPAILQAPVSRLPEAASADGQERDVERQFGAFAPKFAELTNDVVFDDLWRRADLSPRDRSLVTIAALSAMGDVDQLEPYLKRGRDNGLAREDVAEALTHLAFYAGWAKATKALSMARAVLGES
jgi:4-carboxymuconolactone decarboxylase